MTSTCEICIVAALADNGVIGRANALPWRLPADLAHFKRLTLGQPVLMGRRTWESLPGLLPDRRHIVLTRDPGYAAAGAQVVVSLDAALELVRDLPRAMIVGGAELYAQALPLANRMYLTRVHADIDGDTWFPRFAEEQWQEVEREAHPADARHAYPFSFVTLQRREQPLGANRW